ncbi:hypothetical protein A3F06_01160 [candidate division TM6 bacterium RIFCSPHIGHO2_12_FULL_36_22]|nr:MAG: hypothetical protein A3F06_01160 [candidate division TM6 bacterium RIFCSPHIGHO2_12_FULL_36_22]
MMIRKLNLLVLITTVFSLSGHNLYLNENSYCIGAWDVPTKASIPLIYQGEIIKVTNGTFCTKMPRYQNSIAYLFVDVKYIKFDSDGNNVVGLYLDPITPGYEYYQLSKAYAQTNSMQPRRFTWNVNQCELPLKNDSANIRQIPNNTIIIPVISEFFEHTASGSITFDVADWDTSTSLIKLPKPLFKKDCTTTLENELNEVYCALPTLKVIHSPQELITRRADKVEVSFVR